MSLVLLLALGISSQLPKPAPALAPMPPPPAAAALKARREADLRKQVEKKKSLALKKAVQRTARNKRDYEAARAQQEYHAKMAPILAKQQSEMARLAIDQQRANALSSIANAAQKEAAIDLGRLRVEQLEAGVPFMPTPGGMRPYPYAAGGTP